MGAGRGPSEPNGADLVTLPRSEVGEYWPLGRADPNVKSGRKMALDLHVRACRR